MGPLSGGGGGWKGRGGGRGKERGKRVEGGMLKCGAGKATRQPALLEKEGGGHSLNTQLTLQAHSTSHAGFYDL